MDELKKLDKQLNEIWERVQASGREAPAAGGGDPTPLDLLSAERELLQESLRQGRLRFAQEKKRWETLLDERGQMVSALKEEKGRLEAEVLRLRKGLADIQSELQSQLEFQSLERSEREADLHHQISRHQSELGVYEHQLKDMEAAHRQELERYEKALARWKEREKAWLKTAEQNDGEIARLKAQVSELETQRHKDRAGLTQEKNQAEDALKSGRLKAEQEAEALRKALEQREEELKNFQRLLELSREEAAQAARGGEGLEKELRVAQEQAGRLQQELRNMREAWEVERGHWRELWERERSSREKSFDQMRLWEERLRLEREQWLSQFQAEQESRAQAAHQIDRNLERLREAAWTFPRVSGPAEKPARALPRLSWRAPLLAGATGAVLLAGASLIFWTGPRRFQSPVEHGAGLEVRGNDVWYADWMSGQLLQASAGRPGTVAHHGAPSEELHPVTLRWAGSRLWSLDPWSRSLQEHLVSPPFTVLKTWPLALTSPVDFTWDGQGFWVLDQADQVLRRYPDGSFAKADRQAPLPPGWRLSALDFADGEFWGYDASAQRLRSFSLLPEFNVTGEYRLPVHERPESPLTGLSLAGRDVWTLSEKSRAVYRWSRRGLRFRSLF